MITDMNEYGVGRMTSSLNPSTRLRHAGPSLGLVASAFIVLFLAGLYPVTVFGGRPVFPGPGESGDTITNFFRTRSSAVLLCAFFHFGAAIPLGIFTASAVSLLRFLGVRAAGAYIALFGGFATAFNMLASACLLWTTTYPGIAQDGPLLEALFRLQFALGGPGFSAPFGLLLAGISVTAGFRKLLPKWAVILGIMIAAAGEVSWLQIMFPKLVFLIPLTRFPGFVWLIAAGFLLPRSVEREKMAR
jgi:hypothetical protein